MHRLNYHNNNLWLVRAKLMSVTRLRLQNNIEQYVAARLVLKVVINMTLLDVNFYAALLD